MLPLMHNASSVSCPPIFVAFEVQMPHQCLASATAAAVGDQGFEETFLCEHKQVHT